MSLITSRDTTARGERYVRPFPLLVRGDTITIYHGRSGGCIALFPHPTHRSISPRTRRMSLARNFSHSITNLKRHRPHCSSRIKAKRVKGARVPETWRSQTFGMSERSCLALATTTTMTKVVVRAVARARAMNAVLPHHHYARRGKILHETRNW
jgi:hypothetical protein